MAITTTINKSSVMGDRRMNQCKLVFSGNYATGGEAITAAVLGLNVLEMVIFDGVAVTSGFGAANPLKYNPTTGKISFYESSGAGTELQEKTNAEAYNAGLNVLCLAIGY